MSVESTAEPMSPNAPDIRTRMVLDIVKVNAWPEDVAEQVCWLHQHMHLNRLSFGEVSTGVGYSPSTLSRLFSGTYNGNLEAVAAEIRSWRQLLSHRADVHQLALVENRVAKKIFPALDFALANGAIVEIIGESGMGKTFCTEEWIRRGKHTGRAFHLHVPDSPGRRAVLDLLGMQLGISARYSSTEIFRRIAQKISRDQLIIVDEAFRLIPMRPDSIPHGIEQLRDLHDKTGCGVAVIATRRWEDTVRSEGRRYLFEQWVGRTDITVKLPHQFTAREVRQFLVQFWPEPSERLIETSLSLANSRRHVRDLKRVIGMAQRIAKKSGAELAEKHFTDAMRFLAMLADPNAGGES